VLVRQRVLQVVSSTLTVGASVRSWPLLLPRQSRLEPDLYWTACPSPAERNYDKAKHESDYADSEKSFPRVVVRRRTARSREHYRV